MSQSQQQTQATDILEDEIKMSINLPYVEGNFKYLDIIKYYTLSRVKSLLKDQFINWKIQKIKAISFMKLTVVTAY